MLYSGENCQNDNLFVTIGFSFVFLMTAFVFRVAITNFRGKLASSQPAKRMTRAKKKRKKIVRQCASTGKKMLLLVYSVVNAIKKQNASLSTCCCVIISLLGNLTFCASNVLRTLDHHSEIVFGSYVSPISFSIVAPFSVAALLNVSFVWIEFANTAVLNITSRRNMKKQSKRVLGTLCFIYFSGFIIIYGLTDDYSWIAVLTVIYTICIGFAFLKGAFMISRKLQCRFSPNVSPTNGFSKISSAFVKQKEQFWKMNNAAVKNRKEHSESDKASNDGEDKEENDEKSQKIDQRIHNIKIISCTAQVKTINLKKHGKGSAEAGKTDSFDLDASMQNVVVGVSRCWEIRRFFFSFGKRPKKVYERILRIADYNTNVKKVLIFSCALTFHCVLFCIGLMCYFLFNTPSKGYYQILSDFGVLADLLCIHLWIIHYVAG